MEITDKELLAICNLSNLKMEFADVIKEKQRVPDPNNSGKFIEKILSNHTIYSLLKKEIDAIKSNNIDERAFFKKKEENSQSKSSNKEKEGKIPIYSNIIDLKKEAGIVYEYCEKFSYDKDNKMHPGGFTDEWEILGAYDGYEIIKYYLDLYKKYLTEVFVSEDGDIYFYSDKEKHELRKLKKKFDSFEDKDIEVCSQSEKEKIEKSIKETSEIKLYPTREELEEKKKIEEKMKIVLNCIDLASIILPAFKSQIINIPTAIRTARLTEQNTIKLVRGLFTNVHNPEIVSLNKVLGCSYRSLRSSYLSIGLVDIMYGVLKSKRPQVYLERVLKLIIKDFKTNLCNILAEGTFENIFFNLPFATYFLANKITTDIFKEIADDKTLSQEEKNILNEKLELIQKTLKFQTIGLSDSLDIAQEGFGVMVLINRSTRNIVICFKNADADTRNNIEKLTITNELFLLKIFDRFLFPNICKEAKIPLNFNLKLEDNEENKTKVESKDIKNNDSQQVSKENTQPGYKVTITGFDYGADLADLYFYSDNNLNTYGFEKSIKIFKTIRNKLAISLSSFSLTTFGAFIGKEYKSLSKTFFDAINPITFANKAFLLLSLFFPIMGGATYLTGTLIFKYQILKDLFEQSKTNNTLRLLYSKVCEYGFLECKYYSECQKERFLNCRIAEKELKADEDEYFPEIRDVDFEKLLEGDIEIKGELETDFIFSPNSEIKKFSLYFDEKDYLELENNDNYRKVLFDNNIQLYEKVMVQTVLEKYVKIFKIRKKDYIFLILDLLLQNRKNYFEKVDNNVYIGGEIKSISSDDYLYEENDLPLNNKSDDELTKFYKIFNTERSKEAQNRKYQTFERQKMVRDYYKIILENDGKINLEKFIQITYIYVGYGDEIADTLYVLKQQEQKLEFDLEGFYEIFRLIKNINISIKKQLENMSYLYLNDTIFYSNRLYDIKNISMITGNLWYKFWVYIQDDGNMRIFNNKVEGNKFEGYVLNSDINKQYIGSFFRSAMTKIFTEAQKQEPDKSARKQVLKNYYYPQEPKFYTEEGESSFSEMLHTHSRENYANDKSSWDEDELACRTFVTKFNAKTKSQLNKEFVELLKANREKLRQNTKKEQEDISDSKARYALSLYIAPNFNYLDKMINLIENDPSILEEFYEIEEIQQNGLKIYELVIGHFSKTEGNNENDEKYEYNKKIIEYIYNDDEIKRGLVRLKVYMPNYSEESFEIEPDKYILVEGAKLSCTEASIGEMLAGKNIIKINGKNVATLTDNKTGEQIKIFGYCGKKREMCGGECINWENESEIVYLGQKVLTTESKGTCSVYGGKISIVENGTKKSIKVN